MSQANEKTKLLARPGDNGWELFDPASGETLLRTLTKEELYRELDDFMAGETAVVEVHGRDGSVEEERPYPGSSHPI